MQFVRQQTDASTQTVAERPSGAGPPY